MFGFLFFRRPLVGEFTLRAVPIPHFYGEKDAEIFLVLQCIFAADPLAIGPFEMDFVLAVKVGKGCAEMDAHACHVSLKIIEILRLTQRTHGILSLEFFRHRFERVEFFRKA